jgi:RimJ/RimL family protein N-acetyltransferase
MRNAEQKSEILQTERLILRRFTLRDAGFILKLLNDPTWLQFIGDRGVKSLQQAKEYLAKGPIKSYRQNGFGLSLVELKEDGTAIGVCGLLKRENLGHPDVGFAFLPEFTSKGYATEITSSTLKYARDQLRLPTVLAVTTTDNTRSIALLKKLGFNFEKMTKLSGVNEDMMLFRLEL